MYMTPHNVRYIARCITFLVAFRYQAKHNVGVKHAQNYASDTFKTDCDRAIAACDLPGERF